MKIKFEHMTIHNFMSFLDTSISFDECGYILITGTNHNTMDNASSNGSGKSAIWEAITWCLTGETIRGFKNVSNQFVEDDGCYVRLKFRVDNNAYEILRAKDSKEYKSNLKLWVDGEDKSGKGIRDTEKSFKHIFLISLLLFLVR